MKVTILGTGAFGLALSKVLIDNKCDVVMWTPLEEEKKEIEECRVSSKLSNYKISNDIKITTNLEDSIIDSKLILVAIPTMFITSTIKKINNIINKNQYICIASKGIEQNSLLFIHQIIKKYTKCRNIGVISGPSFATDLVSGVPIGLTVASKSKRTLNIIKKCFQNDIVKLYPTTDIIGVEVCGALKNVVAISSGIIYGMNYPVSTQAVLITEFIHDIKKLTHSLGGKKNTILSFAGIGDIFITCTSEKSRNYTFGTIVGSNQNISDYLKNNTVEGAYTLKSIYNLAHKNKIDIPLIDILYDIVFNNMDKQKLIDYLMI